VEALFPFTPPRIEKIEVIARGRVRRARLFYLRDLAGKAARIKEKAGISAAIIAPGVNPEQVPPQSELPPLLMSRALGAAAEARAARFLQHKGYRIVARNWTCRGG